MFLVFLSLTAVVKAERRTKKKEAMWFSKSKVFLPYLKATLKVLSPRPVHNFQRRILSSLALLSFRRRCSKSSFSSYDIKMQLMQVR